MVSRDLAEKYGSAKEKLTAELLQYFDLFRAAFDELHKFVIEYVSVPGHYIGPHNDYPIMSQLDSGFPSFHDFGFFDDRAPRDYVGAIRPRGLAALFGKRQFPKFDFPRGAELADFLRRHQIGERLGLDAHVYEGQPINWLVDNLVADAVARYMSFRGPETPIDSKLRDEVIRRLVLGTTLPRHALRLVIPIAMTHFDVNHFRLTETTYITRLPKNLQLARAQMSTQGTGTVRGVVGAATHAFVSDGWHLEVGAIDEVRKSLGEVSANAMDAADNFFGAIRVATGINTGYAQVLWMPKKWALHYFCDLTPLYGTAVRRYPNEFC